MIFGVIDGNFGVYFVMLEKVGYVMIIKELIGKWMWILVMVI